MGCVKGLQARHGWDNPANLVTFGSTDYAESVLSLTQGEAITSVAWAAKDGCMSYISLKTNKGRELTAGESAGAKVATFAAKEGRYLAAFKGATGNDKSCSPLAALSFRWGFDDCEVAAAVEAPAEVEVEAEVEAEVEEPVAAPVCTTVVSGFATCADGAVMMGGKAAAGFSCKAAACAAEAAAEVAAPAVAAAAATATAGAAAGGKADIVAVKVSALNSLIASKAAAVNSIVAAKTAAVNSVVGAKTAAVNSVVAAKGRKLRFIGVESLLASKAQAVSGLMNAKMGLVQAKLAAKGGVAAAAPVAAKTCFEVCAPGVTVEALQAKLAGSA
jgi:hypothetical protein